MTEKNLASAVAYYKAMADKDLTGMARYLRPDVRLVTLMEELTGKEAVLEAAKRLLNLASGCARRWRGGRPRPVGQTGRPSLR